MHYKNGTEAKNGDHVIRKTDSGDVQVGVLHSISANSTSCNGVIAIAIPGGFKNEYVTIGDIYLAADAFASLDQPKVCENESKA